MPSASLLNFISYKEYGENGGSFKEKNKHDIISLSPINICPHLFMTHNLHKELDLFLVLTYRVPTSVPLSRFPCLL